LRSFDAWACSRINVAKGGDLPSSALQGKAGVRLPAISTAPIRNGRSTSTPDGCTDTGRHVCVSSSSTDLKRRFPATCRSAAQIVSPCRLPWIEGAEAGAGATLLACPLACLSAPGACYAGVRGAQCGPTRFPQTDLPPRHAATIRFSQTRQGAFLLNTLRAAPQHPQPRASKGPTERALQWPSAATGAGRQRQQLASTFGQHTYCTSYYRSVGGISLTEGFQATIRLPKAPPAPSRGWARFSRPEIEASEKDLLVWPCPPAAVGTHRVVNHDRRPRVARQPVNERSRPRSLDLVWKDDSSRVP
jgi:hypothetical protein